MTIKNIRSHFTFDIEVESDMGAFTIVGVNVQVINGGVQVNTPTTSRTSIELPSEMKKEAIRQLVEAWPKTLREQSGRGSGFGAI